MAGLAYGLVPGMAVRYVDDYLDLNSRQEAEARRLFNERMALHARDELPRYHAFLTRMEEAGRDGIDREDVDAMFDGAGELYRLAVRRTIPDLATILSHASRDQVDALAERLSRDAREDREEMADDDEEGRTIGETLEDIEKWVGPLEKAQRRMVVRRLRKMEATRPFWVEWRIESNRQLVELLREQAGRKKIEAFLEGFWIEREGMPRYLEEALTANSRRYRDMIVELDRTLTPEQREKARERLAEYREMVLDMMPNEVRIAVLENGAGGAQGNAKR